MDVVLKLLRAGVQTALITMAGEGSLAVSSTEVVRVHAPAVRAVDGSGAGATFSAGYIYGYLRGWNLEKTARFATAAASLKVTRPGLKMFSTAEIKTAASRLKVERLTLTGDPARRAR